MDLSPLYLIVLIIVCWWQIIAVFSVKLTKGIVGHCLVISSAVVVRMLAVNRYVSIGNTGNNIKQTHYNINGLYRLILLSVDRRCRIRLARYLQSAIEIRFIQRLTVWLMDVCTTDGWLYDWGVTVRLMGDCTTDGWLYDWWVSVRLMGDCMTDGWPYDWWVTVRLMGDGTTDGWLYVCRLS
jgi:hypothetical protein